MHYLSVNRTPQHRPRTSESSAHPSSPQDVTALEHPPRTSGQESQASGEATSAEGEMGSMRQHPCLRSVASSKTWIPEQEAEPGTEVKAGDLYLVSCPGVKKGGKRGSRYPVHVKVYRSSFGHYAVLTASLRAPATYLNLRTCNCRPCSPSPTPSPTRTPTPSSSSSSDVSTTFRVELGGGEGQVIYFEVSPRDRAEVGEWVEAFQGPGVPSPGSISPSLSPVIPRSPIMPTLQESLEEGEEEEEEEIGGLS